LAIALVVAGCGGSSDPQTTSDPDREPIAVDVSIQNRQVRTSATRVRVEVGDSVHLTVTSDEDDIIHVHVVDDTLVLSADEPGEMDFVIPPGTARGTYTVETHNSGLALFDVRVG
jgi:hypothetical protein